MTVWFSSCSWGDRPPQGGFVTSGVCLLKTIVYVDGYNLYYGLLRRSPYKWLDLYRLFQEHVLEPGVDVVEVRYYTAPVLGRMSDDPQSPQRQRLYLEALRKTPPNRVSIIEGRIIAESPMLRLVEPIPAAPEVTRVRVHSFSEKKTDVNLASDLLVGAWTGAYQQAVICSNDTDLEGAIRSVKAHHPWAKLGLVAPIPSHDTRKIAADLKRYVDWAKVLSPVHLERSQLPEKIAGTAVRKPPAW